MSSEVAGGVRIVRNHCFDVHPEYFSHRGGGGGRVWGRRWLPEASRAKGTSASNVSLHFICSPGSATPVITNESSPCDVNSFDIMLTSTTLLSPPCILLPDGFQLIYLTGSASRRDDASGPVFGNRAADSGQRTAGFGRRSRSKVMIAHDNHQRRANVSFVDQGSIECDGPMPYGRARSSDKRKYSGTEVII